MIDTYSEEWRHECEARYVAMLPDREARKAFLKGVERHRGRAHMLALHKSAVAAQRLAQRSGAR